MSRSQSVFLFVGLDVGTSCIGWALVDSSKVIGTGVRIFPEGMDRSRGEKSLNQDRRIARSIRRQTYRRQRRKDKLKYMLMDFGLLPVDEQELAEQVDQTEKAKEVSAGILKPIYVMAERLSFPAFHWVAFTVMVTRSEAFRPSASVASSVTW